MSHFKTNKIKLNLKSGFVEVKSMKINGNFLLKR